MHRLTRTKFPCLLSIPYHRLHPSISHNQYTTTKLTRIKTNPLIKNHTLRDPNENHEERGRKSSNLVGWMVKVKFFTIGEGVDGGVATFSLASPCSEKV